MSQEGQSLIDGLFAARERLLERGVKPGDIALQCGLIGVTLGFLFQITHNVGFLPVRCHMLRCVKGSHYISS